MDRNAIVERLRTLAADDKKRSKAARLRDIIDDVETALAAGVPHSAVVEELAKHGLEMSLATFNTNLRRIRQKRNTAATMTTKQPFPPSLPSTQRNYESDDLAKATNDKSHNPTDLDKIIGSKPDLAALAKLAKRTKK